MKFEEVLSYDGPKGLDHWRHQPPLGVEDLLAEDWEIRK